MNFWLPIDILNKITDRILGIIFSYFKGDSEAKQQTNQQKNIKGSNTIIKAKEVKIYNFNPKLVEEKIRDQEERIQDLETIIESEFEEKILKK